MAEIDKAFYEHIVNYINYNYHDEILSSHLGAISRDEILGLTIISNNLSNHRHMVSILSIEDYQTTIINRCYKSGILISTSERRFDLLDKQIIDIVSEYIATEAIAWIVRENIFVQSNK